MIAYTHSISKYKVNIGLLTEDTILPVTLNVFLFKQMCFLPECANQWTNLFMIEWLIPAFHCYMNQCFWMNRLTDLMIHSQRQSLVCNCRKDHWKMCFTYTDWQSVLNLVILVLFICYDSIYWYFEKAFICIFSCFMCFCYFHYLLSFFFLIFVLVLVIFVLQPFLFSWLPRQHFLFLFRFLHFFIYFLFSFKFS